MKINHRAPKISDNGWVWLFLTGCFHTCYVLECVNRINGNVVLTYQNSVHYCKYCTLLNFQVSYENFSYLHTAEHAIK